jgi:putative endonuclease
MQSQKHGKYYIGSCEDVAERLKRHNAKRVIITKSGVPWILVYKESFATRSEALKRERQIKSYKGGEAFKKLIK